MSCVILKIYFQFSDDRCSCCSWSDDSDIASENDNESDRDNDIFSENDWTEDDATVFDKILNMSNDQIAASDLQCDFNENVQKSHVSQSDFSKTFNKFATSDFTVYPRSDFNENIVTGDFVCSNGK